MGAARFLEVGLQVADQASSKRIGFVDGVVRHRFGGAGSGKVEDPSAVVPIYSADDLLAVRKSPKHDLGPCSRSRGAWRGAR